MIVPGYVARSQTTKTLSESLVIHFQNAVTIPHFGNGVSPLDMDFHFLSVNDKVHLFLATFFRDDTTTDMIFSTPHA